MHYAQLDNLVKGWFVGNFEPSLYKTDAVEVGVKRYMAGDQEDWHYHKVATEITVIVQGAVRMFDQIYRTNDIIVIPPGEGTTFEALEDTITAVVKLPGVINDKYLKGE